MCLVVSGFLGVDLRRLPSVLSGSAFVQALKNTRSKLQAVVDLEREKIGISGVLTQNYRIFKTNFSNHKEKKPTRTKRFSPFKTEGLQLSLPGT